MQWITDVLRLNTRILAAQAVADTPRKHGAGAKHGES
jgi:hypothetical protein